MNYFLTRVSQDLVGKLSFGMLHDNMNIFHLMFHVQQVEETRLRRKNRKS